MRNFQTTDNNIQLIPNGVFMTRLPPIPPSNKVCFKETLSSVTSVSTCQFIPQPIDNKIHLVPNRLYVSGFPPLTTQKQLSDAFRMFGEIINCNVVCTPDYSKCYGFVTFQNVASAEAVRSVYARGRKFFVNGHKLKIKKAQFKPKKTKIPTQVLVHFDKGLAQFTNNIQQAPVLPPLPNGPFVVRYPILPPMQSIMYKI